MALRQFPHLHNQARLGRDKVLPVGFGNKNRPVGLHIIGNYFMEAQMLNVAHQYQQVTDWHLKSPV